jgi:hypothetical protein
MRRGPQGTSHLDLIVTAVVREHHARSHPGGEMIAEELSRVEMIAVAKSVDLHRNMVAVKLLAIIGMSASLHPEQLRAVTAERR